VWGQSGLHSKISQIKKKMDLRSTLSEVVAWASVALGARKSTVFAGAPGQQKCLGEHLRALNYNVMKFSASVNLAPSREQASSSPTL
jgi:hypothetical protein